MADVEDDTGDNSRAENNPWVKGAQPRDRGTRITRAISRATAAAGSFPMITVAAMLIVCWLVGGLFVPGGYGNAAYQLPVSTVSSIVTFLMVFVIQSSQNRDNRALQTKIDALASVVAVMAKEQKVEATEHLLTLLAGLEDAPEREIDREQALVRESVREAAHKRL
jgi:low affinity Fe/Cu permease